MASSSPGLGRQDGMFAGTPTVPMPGVVLFGRYRLDERLGQGGMAEVWRAQDEQLERPVAIKLLHRHLLPDDRSRERFAAEARAVAGLSHPSIVTVHDIVVDDTHAAIVLELVDGEPLNETLAREGRLAELAAAAIAAQIAHALQAAHDRGLVHRDVKPANVLLSPDGRSRLVDFGIARALDDRESSLTLPGTIMGTLRYMAPEQLSDGAADRATDVFGLGSLLYEMLVGRPPFPAATPAALMAQQRQGAPAILRVSPELAGLARTALQHDAERRPRSAGQMAALVERWLEHRGVSSADLPAVVVASRGGGMLPRAAPAFAPLPAVMPAPILEAVGQGGQASPMVDGALASAQPGPPRRRRRRPVDAAGAIAVPLPGLDAVPPPAALASPAVATPASPSAGAVAIAAGQAPSATGAAVPVSPIPVSPVAETAAVTAVRSRRTTLGFGRRVPLITAVGLAGLLLAGLLIAGALTALQAGTTRPTAAPIHASATPVATLPAEPTPGPTVQAVPLPTTAPVVAPPKPKDDGKPKKGPREH